MLQILRQFRCSNCNVLFVNCLIVYHFLQWIFCDFCYSFVIKTLLVSTPQVLSVNIWIIKYYLSPKKCGKYLTTKLGNAAKVMSWFKVMGVIHFKTNKVIASRSTNIFSAIGKVSVIHRNYCTIKHIKFDSLES